MPTTPQVPPTGCNSKSLSASGLVKTGEGVSFLLTITSGSFTVKLWDNTAGSGTVIQDTMTVYPGEQYEIPYLFRTGLYVTITGTGTLTVAYI